MQIGPGEWEELASSGDSTSSGILRIRSWRCQIPFSTRGYGLSHRVPKYGWNAFTKLDGQLTSNFPSSKLESCWHSSHQKHPMKNAAGFDMFRASMGCHSSLRLTNGCSWLGIQLSWGCFSYVQKCPNPGAQSSRPWNVLPMQESAREHEYINMLQHVTTSSREEASSIFLPAPSSSRGIFPCCWGIGGENHGRAPKDFSESVAKPKALGFTNQKVCPNVLYIPQNSRSSLNRWLSKSHLVTWLGTCQTSMGQKVPYP